MVSFAQPTFRGNPRACGHAAANLVSFGIAEASSTMAQFLVITCFN
jgi:hypothetical protein